MRNFLRRAVSREVTMAHIAATTAMLAITASPSEAYCRSHSDNLRTAKELANYICGTGLLRDQLNIGDAGLTLNIRNPESRPYAFRSLLDTPATRAVLVHQAPVARKALWRSAKVFSGVVSNIGSIPGLRCLASAPRSTLQRLGAKPITPDTEYAEYLSAKGRDPSAIEEVGVGERIIISFDVPNDRVQALHFECLIDP